MEDCNQEDINTVNDQVNSQCVYMGPFCEFHSYSISSLSGDQVPYCHYSYVNGFGYILGDRAQIYKYLDSQNLREYADLYLDPKNTDIVRETNVKVVSKCQNKYCQHCEDYDLA